MFQDQKGIDITTVVVKKRNFQRQEKKYSKLLLALIVLVFVVTFLLMVFLLLSGKIVEIYKSRVYIFETWCAFLFIFLAVTLVLFIYAG